MAEEERDKGVFWNMEGGRRYWACHSEIRFYDVQPRTALRLRYVLGPFCIPHTLEAQLGVDRVSGSSTIAVQVEDSRSLLPFPN